MKIVDSLSAPVYVKLTDDFAWPSELMFYLLTGEGTFLCRNHPFFKSSVKVKGPVKEMPSHEAFLIPNYPFISALHMERVVGWFKDVAKEHDSEAIVLLCWNATCKRLEIGCPQQNAEFGNVSYTTPDLPPDWTIIGDIHSHVNGPAYQSFTDDKDEKHRAGLHIVVGKVCSKQPDFFCNAVVDGESFTITKHDEVFAFKSPSTWPAAWMEQLTVKKYSKSWLPWKGKSKYDNKEYDSEGYEYKPYVYQRLIKLEDLKNRLPGDVDLPGGMVLMSPTPTEMKLIEIYAAEIAEIERLQAIEEGANEQTNP